jgi:K+-transporting ATPase ATPase B chain
LTVIFANLAEAVAEGRGKAQAESLRKTKADTMARRLTGWRPERPARRKRLRPHCWPRATWWWSKPDR